AMAEGALARSEADLAIAVTGFAGKAGPDDEPGLVHLALAGGERPIARECHFGDVPRDTVRARTAAAAFEMLAEVVGEDEDRRRAIVYNGEVYNHPDLRPELEAWGWKFATHSDTETVLAAYVRWGDEAWRRLEGMYGAAIWDARERRLTLARDPLGIKPVYF